MQHVHSGAARPGPARLDRPSVCSCHGLLMNEADLLLVFGASFANHTGIYPGHPIIQVDFDPMQLGKFHAVAVPVWGEVGVTARLFTDRLAGAELAAADQAADVAERKRI